MRLAAARIQCVNNLKQIGLALHNYRDTNGGRFPKSTHATGNMEETWVESRGRASGLGRWAKLSRGDIRTSPGNGTFSVWQSGDTGPVVLLSNLDDGVADPNAVGLDATDGIGTDDAVWTIAGGHIDDNCGSSRPGRYEVTVRLSGCLNDGNTTALGTFAQSDPITLYFSVGRVGQFAVDPATYTAGEDAGTVSVVVKRTGGSDGRMTVAYATAAAGQDYTATSGPLTFEDGETRKTVSVPVLNAAAQKKDETFTLALSRPDRRASPITPVGLRTGRCRGRPLWAPSPSRPTTRRGRTSRRLCPPWLARRRPRPRR